MKFGSKGWEVGVWFVLCLGTALNGFGQTPAAPDPAKLAIDTASLPLAAPGREYRFALHTTGGIPPMRWELLQGQLPDGITLSPDGVLLGTPKAPGSARFTVGVTDASRPPQSAIRELTFQVNQPLTLEWRSYAQVNGKNIAGSVAVSNGTEADFDFTLIAVGVDETGKAFTLGYQHFPLKRGMTSFEIPFGQPVPRGKYVVHVDAVGEVPAKKEIYRSRLQTKESLAVTVGP